MGDLIERRRQRHRSKSAKHGPVAGALAIVAVVAVGFAASTPRPTPNGPPSTASVPDCIVVRTESRYVPYGYNHVVILTNGCAVDATCAVATDVNPTPIVVAVQAGATAEVLTFMASPRPSFVATVSCQLQGPRA